MQSIFSDCCQGNSFILTRITTKTEIKMILKKINMIVQHFQKCQWYSTNSLYKLYWKHCYVKTLLHGM